jgi:hypothetical protein
MEQTVNKKGLEFKTKTKYIFECMEYHVKVKISLIHS